MHNHLNSSTSLNLQDCLFDKKPCIQIHSLQLKYCLMEIMVYHKPFVVCFCTFVKNSVFILYLPSVSTEVGEQIIDFLVCLFNFFQSVWAFTVLGILKVCMGIYCFRKGMSLAGFVTKTAITALPVDEFSRETDQT